MPPYRGLTKFAQSKLDCAKQKAGCHRHDDTLPFTVIITRTCAGGEDAPAGGAFLVDIPTGLGTAHLAEMALRVAFADFSATPWRGLEKSERGPNNSSLFRPLAAVVVVAVRVLYRPPNESP